MKPSVFSTVLLVFLLYTDRKLAGETCPTDNGWSEFGGYCYFVSTTAATWRDARDSCHQTAAQLVSIKSPDEQYFINSTLIDLPDAKPYVWTGLHEQDTGRWEWIDGTNVTFVNWAPGESNDTTEQCMALSHMPESSGYWYDHHCESKFLWMCKKHPDSDSLITTPAPTPAQGYCRHTYFQYRDKCYKLGPSDRVTWDEALSLCSSLHPQNMVSILDEKEQAFISSLMFNRETPFWIGARQYHEGEFWWSDNSPFTYTNWYPGQPDGTAGTQSCAYMHVDPHTVGFWEDDICTEEYEYMCMTHVESSNTEPPPSDPHDCKDGYSPWNNNCYRVVHYEQPVSWYDAENDCKTESGSLASITSRYEQAYIFSSLPSEDQCYWIGLLSQEQYGSLMFVWSDKRETLYTQWAAGEPSIVTGPSCVCVDALHGDWHTRDCGETSITEAICKVSEDSAQTLPVPHLMKCPSSDWILFEENCYLVNHAVVDQAEAKSQCRGRFGGDLVSIHTRTTNQVLTAFILAYGSSWIGLEKDSNGGFHWTDGSELEMFNWDENEPTNTTDEECVALNSVNGKWFDTVCDAAQGYICKRKADQANTDIYKGLDYGYQILIILSVVLVLALLLAYVIRKHNQTVPEVSASSAPRSEQFSTQSPSPDDPEHTGYDQPSSGIQLPDFHDVTLNTSDVNVQMKA